MFTGACHFRSMSKACDGRVMEYLVQSLSAGSTSTDLQMEKHGYCCLEVCFPELSLSQVDQLLACCFPQS